MRIVIDTNVFVSALIKPTGTAGIVVQEVLGQEGYTLLVSENIIGELRTTLFYRKVRKYIPFSDDQINLWVASLRMLAHEINPRFTYETIVAADPKDDCYIIAAIEGKADVIISGDKHLLDLNPYQGISILKPMDLLTQIKK